MADHSQQELNVPSLDPNQIDTHAQAYLYINGAWQTGGGPLVYYDMCGHDSACSDGAALHTWRVTSEPDTAGTFAGSLPCGGPLVDIFVCRVIAGS